MLNSRSGLSSGQGRYHLNPSNQDGDIADSDAQGQDNTTDMLASAQDSITPLKKGERKKSLKPHDKK